jgi:hypothetical protein
MAHVFFLREIIERRSRGTYKIVEESKSAKPLACERPSGLAFAALPGLESTSALR